MWTLDRQRSCALCQQHASDGKAAASNHGRQGKATNPEHRRGWLPRTGVYILCANAGPRSRHPQWQSSPFLLAVSRGAHALARRARSHCSSSTILHRRVADPEERHFKKAAACSSHAGDAAACFSPHSHRCPHSVACFSRVLASQVFMLCKCDSRAHVSQRCKTAWVALSFVEHNPSRRV